MYVDQCQCTSVVVFSSSGFNNKSVEFRVHLESLLTVVNSFT